MGKIGSTWRCRLRARCTSHKINMSQDTIARIKLTMISGLFHASAWDPACCMANTKNPELESIVALPRKSMLLKAVHDRRSATFSWGQKLVIIRIVTRPQGTLVSMSCRAMRKFATQTYFMLKSHLQSDSSDITPPIKGPRTNAVARVAPIKAPMRLGRCTGPTSISPIWVRLYRPDAPIPWNARQMILGQLAAILLKEGTQFIQCNHVF